MAGLCATGVRNRSRPGDWLIFPARNARSYECIDRESFEHSRKLCLSHFFRPVVAIKFVDLPAFRLRFEHEGDTTHAVVCYRIRPEWGRWKSARGKLVPTSAAPGHRWMMPQCPVKGTGRFSLVGGGPNFCLDACQRSISNGMFFGSRSFRCPVQGNSISHGGIPRTAVVGTTLPGAGFHCPCQGKCGTSPSQSTASFR